MEANVELDTTALNILEELHDRLAARDIELWLARVKNDVLIPMKNHGVAAVMDGERLPRLLTTARGRVSPPVPELDIRLDGRTRRPGRGNCVSGRLPGCR